MIQGAVSGIMNRNLIAICHKFPEARIAHNAHDGAKVSFPVHMLPQEVHSQVREIVEKPWDINGHHVSFPATWDVKGFIS